MRLALWLAGTLALISACDDDTSRLMMDLSAEADMAMTPAPDMSRKNCLAIITCGAGCGGNPACQQGCTAGASQATLGKYQALFACTYGACTPGGAASADGGVAPCTMVGDTSAGCQACLLDQSMKTCAAQLAACTSD
jgi:hypothetical protein